MENVELTLVAILKCSIDKAHHTGATVVGATGFGPLTAPQIISFMQLNYGKPGIGEIKKSLLCLNDPMDRNMPIEVILTSLEEVQMFLLASPEENRELKEVNLINHALIKLSDIGILYMKALEKWNGRLVADQRKCATFRTVMVGEYNRMLAEGAGTTIQQEGYGTAFHTDETMSDEESLTEIIVKYAEHASMAKSRVSELEGRLYMLDMGSTAALAPPVYAPQPPPHTAYFAPEAPTFQAQQTPQTIAFQPPRHETQWIPAQQQQ